jgi:2-dehydropantoate 2-reductase
VAPLKGDRLHTMNKNIVIFGAGAIGSMIAAYLAKAGERVTLIDPWFAHVVAMQHRGIHVTDPDGEFTVNLRALHVDQAKDLGAAIDILFLAVKSYDTEWSTRYLAPYLSAEGFIVSAQNGLNEELISSIVGNKKTIGMVVMSPSSLSGPGTLFRKTAIGDQLAFKPGELDGSDTPRLRDLAELLSHAGQCRTTDNIWGALWVKLASNAMGNGIAGLTGMGRRALWNDATARRVMMHIGGEVVEVGEAGGIRFESIRGISPEHFKDLDGEGARVIDEAFLKQAGSWKGIRDHSPSLLQDVRKARRSEIDYLNGVVVRKGREQGIATPLNEAVVDAVHRLEAGEIASEPANLEMFREYIQGNPSYLLID